MNLVESENWTLYDYKAVCVPATLVAYMAGEGLRLSAQSTAPTTTCSGSSAP